MNCSQKKVIAQILPSLESGGVERGVVDIAKEVKNRGFESIVISNGGTMTYLLKEAGIKHITLDVKTKNPFKIYRNIKKIRKLINEFHIDLIHVRSRAPMISAYFACKTTNTKIVTTVHGNYSLGLLKCKNFAPKRFYNSIMLKSDAIIAVSEFIKNYIIENYQKHSKQDLTQKTTVITRGVDLKYFNPSSIFIGRTIDLAKKWGLPEDKKIILFPARITAWKGHEFLIESLKKVKSDFVCIFVGSDHGHKKFRKKLQEKIIAQNLSQQIKFVGTCKEMPVAYELANLVISASVKPEAFGRIAIEAQAMKKIIIATNIGGSLETIIDKKTGFLTENENTDMMAEIIDKALTMPISESDKIRENARIHVEENFSNQKMYQKTIEVYNFVLKI